MYFGSGLFGKYCRPSVAPAGGAGAVGSARRWPESLSLELLCTDGGSALSRLLVRPDCVRVACGDVRAGGDVACR